MKHALVAPEQLPEPREFFGSGGGRVQQSAALAQGAAHLHSTHTGQVSVMKEVKEA